MKVLLTSDWQCDFSNLDQCELAKKELFKLAKQYSVQSLIIVGDAKQQYNPIDARVPRFWVQFIQEAKRRSLTVEFLLGNHDRIGQYADAQNWLPILAAAGATVHDKVEVSPQGRGFYLFWLPYRSSIEELKAGASKLAAYADSLASDCAKLLLFHCDLTNAQYSYVSSIRSDAKFSVQDLQPDKYDQCLGGHIHLPQHVADNVAYIGSPFACDWGEANQQKRYVIFDSDTKQCLNIRSSIPGWYDKTVKGYQAPNSWEGCRLRLHVSVDATDNYSKVIDKARKKAEDKYPGALVFTVAEFTDTVQEAKFELVIHDPDHVKVRAYVEQTIPVELRKQTEKIISYLSFKLAQVSPPSRSGEELEFLWARTRNMLSYKELEVNYKKQGLVVVQGEHKNWSRRSNGSGKTNFLQPIPLALQGVTFKGQKYDRWAREKTKDTAEVILVFKDAKKRKIKIVRRRRPARLQLFINGVDHSSGMKSTQKNGTQMLIEQISGFTWSTLANAVYIDSAVTNAFLDGTTKARAEVLSKIQNLERFELAQKIVSKERLNVIAEIKSTEDSLDEVTASYSEAGALLASMQADVHAQYKAKKKKLSKLRDEYAARERVHKQLAVELEDKRTLLGSKVEAANKKIVRLDKKLTVLESRLSTLETQVHKAEKLRSTLECPTCFQSVDKSVLADTIEAWLRAKEKLEIRLPRLKAIRQRWFTRSYLLEGEYDKLAIDIAADARKLQGLATAVESAFDVCAELKDEMSKDTASAVKLKKKRVQDKRRIRVIKRLLESLDHENAFLDYCSSALSRAGIPLFLNKQLCPVLNKAAAEYSDIFAENAIQVRFGVVDGEFLPQIVNVHGSDQTDGQSVGERALAGIITSFALRAVSPLCNILVLDEPGGGLDSENAKCFANGLQKLKSRFDTIFVVTHNPIIIGELSGESVITIVKKNGVSAVK
jgi:DNA repair exonuclease SbcCD nuclease subunit